MRNAKVIQTSQKPKKFLITRIKDYFLHFELQVLDGVGSHQLPLLHIFHRHLASLGLELGTW